MCDDDETNSIYHSSRINDLEKSYLPEGFEGIVYNLSYKWLNIIPKKEDQPIKYLEVGAFQGANICSLMKTYAIHKDSELHCIDPWINYDGYQEYTNSQKTNYSKFLKNISKLSSNDIQKLYIYRNFSKNVIPTFKDDYFDIIFIDGNHHRTYILEDAIHCFRKLKPGGWLIFDDMHNKDVELDVKCFLTSFGPEFETKIITPWGHLMCQRKTI